MTDAIAVDTDGDGKIDALAVDTDDDGKADKLLFDTDGDGVDEMITMWWPAVYTYKGGKVKKVFSGDIGRVLFQKAYKKKKVIVVTLNDPAYTTVSKSYLKWNGSQFVYKATLTPTNSYAKQHGVSSRYYINGKGNVSKKTANAYVKKLVGKAKATKITYKEL